jgi:hypothetical protein
MAVCIHSEQQDDIQGHRTGSRLRPRNLLGRNGEVNDFLTAGLSRIEI